MPQNWCATWVEFAKTGVLGCIYTSRQDLRSTFMFADKGLPTILQADVLHVSGGTRIVSRPLSLRRFSGTPSKGTPK